MRREKTSFLRFSRSSAKLPALPKIERDWRTFGSKMSLPHSELLPEVSPGVSYQLTLITFAPLPGLSPPGATTDSRLQSPHSTAICGPHSTPPPISNPNTETKSQAPSRLGTVVAEKSWWSSWTTCPFTAYPPSPRGWRRSRDPSASCSRRVTHILMGPPRLVVPFSIVTHGGGAPRSGTFGTKTRREKIHEVAI
jgi:hypothetical protein